MAREDTSHGLGFGRLCPRSPPNCLQRFADLRWAGFSAQMLMRRTELSITTKLSVEHETPPITNVLLCPGFLSAVKVFRI